MKKEYSAMKAGIIQMIYKNMYKSNYIFENAEQTVVSGKISETNKRAIAIAIEEKCKYISKEPLIITVGIVSEEDNKLNKMALSLCEVPLKNRNVKINREK